MNGNNRYQQNNRYQGTGTQQNNRSQQADPHRWERQSLERELRHLHSRLAALDAQIDALFFQMQQLDRDIQQHHSSIPATVALEIGRAITNAVGIPFLPQAYRNWHYKRERLLQMESNLKYRAIALKQQRDALIQQIEQTQIDIDLFKYHP